MAQALYMMYNLQLRLDIKYSMDGGSANVFAVDAPGTEVFFNKVFKDIDSITVAAKSTVERKVVFDFVDIPNPVSFKVLLYDNAGNRVDGVIAWKARGKL